MNDVVSSGAPDAPSPGHGRGGMGASDMSGGKASALEVLLERYLKRYREEHGVPDAVCGFDPDELDRDSPEFAETAARMDALIAEERAMRGAPVAPFEGA